MDSKVEGEGQREGERASRTIRLSEWLCLSCLSLAYFQREVTMAVLLAMQSLLFALSLNAVGPLWCA
jgi:hypothetical protein